MDARVTRGGAWPDPPFLAGHAIPKPAFDELAGVHDMVGNLREWLASFHGEKGRQQVPMIEKWILGVLAVGWATVTAVLLMP